jgi:uncharacterized protein
VASFAPEAEAAALATGETWRGEVTLVNQDGSVVCNRCTVADTMFTRMRGLLGRKELPRGDGMLIRPAPSVMTFFMRFPIDVIFLDRSGTVLKVVENLKPWHTSGCRRAHSTLELAAGEARTRAITVGDRLVAGQPPGRS